MEQKSNDPISVLDRAFTLIFLITSVLIVPTTYAIINATDASEGLVRGSLFSSVIALIMLVVTIYGLAVLLNIQWLRFAGFYGLFCVVAKAWLILFSWLSTNPDNYALFSEPSAVYAANFACLFITPLVLWAWQRRNNARIDTLTYYMGFAASYDLFLVFGFLFNFVLFTYIQENLIVPISGMILMFISGEILAAFLKIRDQSSVWFSKKISSTLFANYSWLIAYATLALLFPIIPFLSSPLIQTILCIALLAPTALTIRLIVTMWSAKQRNKKASAQGLKIEK